MNIKWSKTKAISQMSCTVCRILKEIFQVSLPSCTTVSQKSVFCLCILLFSKNYINYVNLSQKSRFFFLIIICLLSLPDRFSDNSSDGKSILTVFAPLLGAPGFLLCPLVEYTLGLSCLLQTSHELLHIFKAVI